MARWQVIVGNVGVVYSGDHAHSAYLAYREYVRSSCAMLGRAGGESVTVLRDDDIYREYVGRNDREPMRCRSCGRPDKAGQCDRCSQE